MIFLTAKAPLVGIEVDGKNIPVVHIVLNSGFIGKDDEVILRIDKLCQEHLSESEIPYAYKFHEAFATNPISAKRDYRALMLEREGFYGVENGVVRRIVFN
jgi:hypothetical protein